MSLDIQALGGIRGVQRGSVSVGAGAAVNVPITSVNMAKTFVNLLCDSGGRHPCHLALINPTTLEIIMGPTGYAVSWEVIEFF